jgi:hypothetical protein
MPLKDGPTCHYPIFPLSSAHRHGAMVDGMERRQRDGGTTGAERMRRTVAARPRRHLCAHRLRHAPPGLGAADPWRRMPTGGMERPEPKRMRRAVDEGLDQGPPSSEHQLRGVRLMV